MTLTMYNAQDDFAHCHKILDGPSEEQVHLSMRTFPQHQRLNVFFNIQWVGGIYEKNVPIWFVGLLHRLGTHAFRQGGIFFEAVILEPHKEAGSRIVGIYCPGGPRFGAFKIANYTS